MTSKKALHEVEPDEDDEEETQAGEDWLTRAEVAQKLGISLPIIYKLEKRGHLHAKQGLRHGKSVACYSPEEVAVLENYKSTSDERELKGGVAAEEFSPGPHEYGLQAFTAMSGAMKQAQAHLQQLMSQVITMNEKIHTTLATENEKIRSHAIKLEEESWKMHELMREAADTQHKRNVEEAQAKHSMQFKEQVLERITTYFPLLGALAGSKLAPEQSKLFKEAALTGMLDTMTVEQIEALGKSGALNQAQYTTILAIKERLITERNERLKKDATAAENVERSTASIFGGGIASAVG